LFYDGLGRKDEAMAEAKNRYSQIIEAIFLKYFQRGSKEILFERSDLVAAAKKLRVKLPKNLGDVLYSFRYRVPLPVSILSKAPEGFEWIIRAAGRARYKFVLATKSAIVPSKILKAIIWL